MEKFKPAICVQFANFCCCKWSIFLYKVYKNILSSFFLFDLMHGNSQETIEDQSKMITCQFLPQGKFINDSQLHQHRVRDGRKQSNIRIINAMGGGKISPLKVWVKVIRGMEAEGHIWKTLQTSLDMARVNMAYQTPTELCHYRVQISICRALSPARYFIIGIPKNWICIYHQPVDMIIKQPVFNLKSKDGKNWNKSHFIVKCYSQWIIQDGGRRKHS